MLDRAGVYGDQALWMRKMYKKAFQDRSITAVIRPRDRSDENDKNHIPGGVPLPVRFIKGPGNAEMGARGNLLPDDGITIERTDCIVKHLKDLTIEDLHGCAPDCSTPELARYHLAVTYDIELPGLDDVVTVWRFKYLPNATE
jgi:hypothetical protein